MEANSKQINEILIQNPKQLELKQFEIGEILGTGCFARVRIAKDLHSKKFYAMKIVKKSEIIKLQQVYHVFNEMKILSNIDHNFIIKFEGYIQDNKYLYLVEELVYGGELFTYLQSMGKFDLETTKFYAAHIVCIFEYLHAKNIIYRDLKPENVLIDKSGYLKLSDFGFAKFCNSRTYTICGTPEYLAPEILLNKGHGKAADWWTLGVFIYELLAGFDPFADEDPLKIYENIIAGKVKYPTYFDKKAKCLVKKLLKIDLSKRYGNLVGGVSDIKNHKFFHLFNFNKLLNMELKSPYVPKVISNSDLSNFLEYPDSLKEVQIIDPKDDPFINWSGETYD